MVLSFLVAGCGTGSDLNTTQTSGDKPASGPTVHIVMKSLAFNPTNTDAKVGQTVTWTNDDEAPHNVTYVSGPKFASSRPMMPIGAKFSLRLTEPGTIHYVCTIHPWMHATIVVSP